MSGAPVYTDAMIKLGAGGIEQILDVPLSDSEKAGMTKAADAVKELVGLIG